jgi:hypothetical protein
MGNAGTSYAPALFDAQQGTRVDLPITAFVQTLLSGPDAAGRLPSHSLAILATPEPDGFSFAEFFGPGPNEPVLKLILTASPPLELP